MSTDLKNLAQTYTLPDYTTANTTDAADDADASSATAATSGADGTDTTQASSVSNPQDVMLALNNLAAAGYFGTSTYGGVSQSGAVDGSSGSAALGRVAMPASSYGAVNQSDLSSMMGTLSSYDASSGVNTGASSAVGNSAVLGAESGNSYDLSGIDDSTLAAAAAMGNTGLLSNQEVTVNNPLNRLDTNQPATTGASTSSVATSDTGTTNTTTSNRIARADGESSISDTTPTTALSSSTVAADLEGTSSSSSSSSSGTTTSESATLATTLDDNSKTTDKSKCHKLNKGEEANSKVLQGLGLSVDQANTVAKALNTTSQYGTSGDVRDNLINSILTLNKLQESGNTQAASTMRTTLQTVAADLKGSKDGTLDNQGMTDVNTAAAYVQQTVSQVTNTSTNPDASLSNVTLTAPTVIKGQYTGDMSWAEYAQQQEG